MRRRQRHHGELVEDHDLADVRDIQGEGLAAEHEDAGADHRRGVEQARRHRANRRTAVRSCSAVKGLGRYSSAPCLRPQRRALSWVLELTTTTGVCFVRWSLGKPRGTAKPLRFCIT